MQIFADPLTIVVLAIIAVLAAWEWWSSRSWDKLVKEGEAKRNAALDELSANPGDQHY